MDDTQRMIGLLRRLKVEMNGAVVDAMRSRGLDYPLSYGVSVPTIREIAKAYAPAHAFALFLFRQQVRELKLAAAFVDDPSEVTAAQMREWADGLTNTELVEQVVSALFRHAPDAPDMALEWMGSPEPMKRYAGLLTAASAIRAEKNRAWADRFFEQADRIARRGDLESFVGRGLVMLMRVTAVILLNHALRAADRADVRRSPDKRGGLFCRRPTALRCGVRTSPRCARWRKAA